MLLNAPLLCVNLLNVVFLSANLLNDALLNIILANIVCLSIILLNILYLKTILQKVALLSVSSGFQTLDSQKRVSNLAMLPILRPENSTIPRWVSSGNGHLIGRHLTAVKSIPLLFPAVNITLQPFLIEFCK